MSIRKDIVLYNDDCLKVMPLIPDKSVSAIICDLPYGTTASGWDSIIPFNKLWEQYNRIIKDDGAIVLFASGSFTYKVVNSNPDMYKYKWIWVKSTKTNFVNAKNRPMTSFEEVLVFSKGTTANGSPNRMKYNPQGVIRVDEKKKVSLDKFGSVAGKRPSHQTEVMVEGTNYPCDCLYFESVVKPIHPTQKPTDLVEYLVRTYTDEGDVVLDNCMGSGTTGVACKRADREFIGIEMDEGYFSVAEKRIKDTKSCSWF